MIHGGCSIVIFFLYYYGSTQANGDIDGENSAVMGSNRMIVISLYLIIYSCFGWLA